MGVASRSGSRPWVTVDGTIDEGEASMSARPNRQERIQQDLDELLRQSATLAKALLIRNGEFFPFGATIGKRGKFDLITPIPEGNRPTAQDVVEAVFTNIRSQSGSLRASSMTAIAATESGSDAVRIELEHVEGSSLVIALPYTRQESGAFTYGGMEARRVEPRIWAEGTSKARNRKATRTPSRTKTAKGVASKGAAAKKSSKQTGRSTPRLASKSVPRSIPKSAPKSSSKVPPKVASKGTSRSRPKAAPRPTGVAKKTPRKPGTRGEDSSPHRTSSSGRARLHAQPVRTG